MGEVILTMKDIDKYFPGVHALDHVDLEVRKGEVLALMGENGAGKSTLMKVLTGIYKKDSGTITYEGKEVEFANTREAQDNGIVIVHQELNMLGVRPRPERLDRADHPLDLHARIRRAPSSLRPVSYTHLLQNFGQHNGAREPFLSDVKPLIYYQFNSKNVQANAGTVSYIHLSGSPSS